MRLRIAVLRGTLPMRNAFPSSLCLALFLALPAYAARVVQIAGADHFLVLLDDGNVSGWGSCEYGQLAPVSPPACKRLSAPTRLPLPLPARALAASETESFVALTDGSVIAWGGRSYGANSAPVPGLSDIVSLSDHLAVRADGTVWRWRSGEAAERVEGLEDVVTVVADFGSFIALTREGHAYAWGSNKNGRLGLGHRDDVPAPTRIPGLEGVLSAGLSYFAGGAVTRDGRVWTWGENQSGQLGNGKRSGGEGETGGFSLTPAPVPGISGATSFSMGAGHACARLKDGTVRVWGHDGWGQLGVGTSGGYHEKPMPIPRLAHVQLLECLSNASFAVTADGQFFAWGVLQRAVGGPLSANVKSPIELNP